VKSILLGVFAVVALLVPARAVVHFHLSMQKMAVTSDVVVLCEEVEIDYDGMKYSDFTYRTAVVRCEALRVFKGALEAGKEFTVRYSPVSRRPLRAALREEHADGVTVETPAEFFPPGRALLFLTATAEAGVFAVQGAKLIQQDEVYDLGEEQGMGPRRFRAQQYPENRVVGDCLKYGEAELVADYLKGMELLKDHSLPPQFVVVEREDPLANDPGKTQGVALALGLIPLLVIGVAYRACRSRLPKTNGFRRGGWVFAGVVAVVTGVHVHAVTTIWAQRPARWGNIRAGMTIDDLRCHVTREERYYGHDFKQSGERVMLRSVAGLNLRGSWQLRVRYDANEVIESVTISYRGKFSRFVPASRQGGAK
jgi:hypothetical protein